MALLCDMCGAVFSSGVDFTAHRISEHHSPAGSRKRFCCECSGKLFSTKFHIHCHLRTSCKTASNSQTLHSEEEHFFKIVLDKEEYYCHIREICSENTVSCTDSEDSSLRVTCYICHKLFTTRKSMFRHMRNIHEVEPSLIGPDSTDSEDSNLHVTCHICDKRFTTRKNMCRHMRNVNEVEPSLTGPNCTDSEDSSLHVTSYKCDRRFTESKNMYKHMRDIHEVEPSLTGPNSMHCPFCYAECRTYNDVDGHLHSCHGIEQKLEELSFDSLQDFNTWKLNEEAAVLAQYVATGRSGSTRTYFVCHRSGSSRQKSESSRIRRIPLFKIGKTFPARIILIENGETFKVQYFKTHVGHELSVKFLQLTKEKRCLLASRMQEGVPAHNSESEVESVCLSDNHKSGIENIITVI